MDQPECVGFIVFKQDKTGHIFSQQDNLLDFLPIPSKIMFGPMHACLYWCLFPCRDNDIICKAGHVDKL